MAQAAASSVNKEMEISMERLSTGKRINGASDDAAGVAIASRLTSEIKGTNQAIRNAMDAQALIDTAEGAHAEVENILQRMRELAVQASNDTNATADRSMLQEEFDQLHDEINRISAATTWAGQNLLDGSGGDGNGKYNFQIGSAATSGTDNIEVTFGSLATDATIMTHNAALSTHKSGQSAVTLPSLTFQFELSTAAGTAVTDELSVAYSTTTGVVAVSDITALNAGATADIDSLVIANSTTGVTKTVAIAVGDTEALVAAKIATVLASDEFEPTLSVDSSAASSGHLVISDDRNPSSSGGSLTTVAAARSLIADIDGILENLNGQRAEMGSYSNRLDSTVSNLTNISSNLQAGRGRIEDADFAAETTSLAKSQILQQASTAMLAQANASKQNVLSLLQG
ncbi:flagellin [Paracoccaceae bacterium]|jgi:flagellin|nr:flagellin [Paracoccaceae bacterium]